MRRNLDRFDNGEARCPWDGRRCVCVDRCRLDVRLDDITIRALEQAFTDESRELEEAVTCSTR